VKFRRKIRDLSSSRESATSQLQGLSRSLGWAHIAREDEEARVERRKRVENATVWSRSLRGTPSLWVYISRNRSDKTSTVRRVHILDPFSSSVFGDGEAQKDRRTEREKATPELTALERRPA
jgi:hypothetical protein